MLNPAIIALLHDGQTKTLKLKFQNLTKNDAITLARHLPNSQITKLDISYNNIGDQGAIAIINNLQYSNIKVLNFAFNELTNNTAITAATNMHFAKKIQHCDLSDNYIKNKGAIALAQNLKYGHLQSLDLSSNYIENKGAIALAQNLKYSHLQSLDLVDNNGIKKGGIQVFRDALAKYPYMTEITLPQHHQDRQDRQIKHYIERNNKILGCAIKTIHNLKDINNISLQDIRALNKQDYQAFEIFNKTGKINLLWESDNQQPNKELICNKIQQAINYYYPQITHIVKGAHLESDMARNASLADLEPSGLLGEIFQYCNVLDVHY